MTDRWVDTKEAAAHVGLHPNTLEKYRTYGGGPEFAKINRSVRYRLSSLDQWAGTVVATSTSQLGAA